MHKSVAKVYLEQVRSLREGQLLLQTSTTRLVTDTTRDIPLIVPTGRGEVKSFGFTFWGNNEDLVVTTFSILIGGKEVNLDMQAVAFTLIGNDKGQTFGATAGASRLAKNTYRVPEGQTVVIRYTTGSLNPASSTYLNLVSYFTEFFIPQEMNFNLTQAFTGTFPDSAFTRENFIIPTDRGRVVGISLLAFGPFDTISNIDSGAEVLINGVEIMKNFNIVNYFAENNMQYTNNWVCNIQGGAQLQINMDNQHADEFKIAVILYFSEEIESQLPIEAMTVQQPIS